MKQKQTDIQAPSEAHVSKASVMWLCNKTLIECIERAFADFSSDRAKPFEKFIELDGDSNLPTLSISLSGEAGRGTVILNRAAWREWCDGDEFPFAARLALEAIDRQISRDFEGELLVVKLTFRNYKIGGFNVAVDQKGA